jgi:hypothetical protein
VEPAKKLKHFNEAARIVASLLAMMSYFASSRIM